MFDICRNSMARICTCEMMETQVHKGGVAVWNARAGGCGCDFFLRETARSSGCDCDGSCVQRRI